MTRVRNNMGNRISGQVSGLLIVVLLFAASVAGVGWIGMGMVDPGRWPIRWLEINGDLQRVSSEQLQASLSAEMDDSFFTVDVAALELAARRISWVSTIEVQKIWPDTVSVTVSEFEPVAHWNRGSLIASDGEVFAVPEADDIQGLPWLEGPDSTLDDVLATWVGVDEALLPLGLQIDRLSLDDRGSWSLTLNNGTRVFLGRDSMEERLDRLLSGWDALMEQQDVPPQGIDLRYTNGFAVAWQANSEEKSENGI